MPSGLSVREIVRDTTRLGSPTTATSPAAPRYAVAPSRLISAAMLLAGDPTVATTVSVTGSIAQRPLTWLVTSRRVPSGVRVGHSGKGPTAIVSITVEVAVSMTVTSSLDSLTTYARVPSGEAATLYGLLPTGIVAMTVSVAAANTDTVFEPKLAT